MKRREFSALGGAIALMTSLRTRAQARPQAGRDYLVLQPPAGTESVAGKIEVVDFFWYSCPHCNAFEPALEAWISRLPADVQLVRAPVAFRNDFVPQQKLYHTLETMGLVNELHAKVFHEIHGLRKTLTTEETILTWVQQQKAVDATRFAETYRSFAVANKVRRSTRLQDQYKVSGVPALGVAGRYYVDGTTAGNMARALAIVDSLIEMSRRPA